MRRPALALALILAAGSLSACAEYTTTGEPAEQSADAHGAEAADPLAGTWTLTSSTLETKKLETFGITATFADGSLSGKAPVNNYSASYEVDGHELTIGEVASTMMAGEPAAMRAEGTYFALLATVTAFETTGEELTLLAQEKPVLVYGSGATAGEDAAAEQLASSEDVAATLVGMTAEEAEAAVVAAGLTYRVVSVDGKGVPATADYRPDRINVALVEGKVESATVG